MDHEDSSGGDECRNQQDLIYKFKMWDVPNILLIFSLVPTLYPPTKASWSSFSSHYSPLCNWPPNYSFSSHPSHELQVQISTAPGALPMVSNLTHHNPNQTNDLCPQKTSSISLFSVVALPPFSPQSLRLQSLALLFNWLWRFSNTNTTPWYLSLIPLTNLKWRYCDVKQKEIPKYQSSLPLSIVTS